MPTSSFNFKKSYFNQTLSKLNYFVTTKRDYFTQCIKLSYKVNLSGMICKRYTKRIPRTKTALLKTFSQIVCPRWYIRTPTSTLHVLNSALSSIETFSAENKLRQRKWTRFTSYAHVAMQRIDEFKKRVAIQCVRERPVSYPEAVFCTAQTPCLGGGPRLCLSIFVRQFEKLYSKCSPFAAPRCSSVEFQASFRGPRLKDCEVCDGEVGTWSSYNSITAPSVNEWGH